MARPRLQSDPRLGEVEQLVLEQKGLLESSFSEPTADPGGKARRVFRLLPNGLSALKAARRAVDRLAAGTLLAPRT